MCYFLFIIFILQTLVSTGLGKRKGTCGESSKDPKNLNSFLWKLDRDPPSYFFGTIHVPYSRVWDYIPENTKLAFDYAEYVFFELDLTDPYTISALANCQLLPPGERLANLLPHDIYVRLKRHLEYIKVMMSDWMTADQKDKGLYADFLFNAIAGDWERKRPVWVMLMVNSLTENDIKTRGIPVLDLYLAQEAERIGKVTGAVERVEEQCVPLNELNFSQVLFALNQTLWQHEIRRSTNHGIRYSTDDLVDHYNCGDLNTVIFNHDTAQVPNLVNNSLPPQDLHTAKLIDDYFRMELIDKRNQRMADRVTNLLKDHPRKSFFFAFGAGHFLGNDTVIHKLEKEGYHIEHIPADRVIPHLKSEKRRRNRKKKLKDRRSDMTLGDFWRQLDTDSRLWLEKQQKHKRKMYDHMKDKPFNDLWIRMDTNGPNLMSRLAEKYASAKKSTTTVSEVNSANSSFSCNIWTSYLITLLIVILHAIHS